VKQLLTSCPAIEGLEKEGKAMVKKTDDALVDSVILQGALEVRALQAEVAAVTPKQPV
jgi:hypothetical protein